MKKENLNAGLGTIRTYSGKYVNVLSFKEDDVHTLDIAFGLAASMRFGGHNMIPVNVLQHSLDTHDIVSRLTDNTDTLLAALLHDAPEAYLSDLSSPIKRLMPEYIEVEESMLKTILMSYEVDTDYENFQLPEEVKYADALSLQREWDAGIDKHNTVVGFQEIPEPCYLDIDKEVSILAYAYEEKIKASKTASNIIRFVNLVKQYYGSK